MPKSPLHTLSASRNALSRIRRSHRSQPVRRLWPLAAAVVTVVAAASCSSSGSGSTSSSNSGTGLSTLALAVPDITTSLDQSDYVGLSYLFGQPMFEGTLLRYKPLPANATSLDSPTDMEPGLASSYQMTSQGIVLTLRKAKAPSGDVLSPADVQWTFQREAALDPVGQFYMSIAGINPKDPVTILGADQVRINGKLTPMALVPLVEPEFDIIDSKLAKSHATSSDPWAKTWLSTHSASYGPYQVQSFQSASRMTLTPNPNYWAGPPPFKQVDLIANTGQSASELLQSGTVNGVLEVPLANFAQLRSTSSVKAQAAPTLGQDVLELNERYGPFANADVRRAMSMAINRAALVSGPYFGVGKPSVSVASRSIPGTTGTSKYYTYNLSAAKALLAQTPYKNGFTVTLNYQQAEVSSVNVSSLVVNLVSELGQLGIKVQANDVSSDAEFRAGEEAHKYQAWLLGEGPVVADAAYLFGLYHTTDAESNFTGESNPQIDALVAKATVLPIGTERTALMNQAIALWNANMYDIPLVQDESTNVFSSNVCGLTPSPYQLVLPYDLAQC